MFYSKILKLPQGSGEMVSDRTLHNLRDLSESCSGSNLLFNLTIQFMY